MKKIDMLAWGAIALNLVIIALAVIFPRKAPLPSQLTCFGTFCSAEIKPMTVTLKFVTRADFDGGVGSAYTGKNYVLYGLASPQGDQCEVTIPTDGSKIYADTKTEKALFSSTQFENTLVHELLHCLVDSWHADNPAQAYFNEYYYQPGAIYERSYAGRLSLDDFLVQNFGEGLPYQVLLR